MLLCLLARMWLHSSNKAGCRAFWPLLGVWVWSHPQIYYLDVLTVPKHCLVPQLLCARCLTFGWDIWILPGSFGLGFTQNNNFHGIFLSTFISLKLKASVFHSCSIQQCGRDFLCSPVYVVCLKESLQYQQPRHLCLLKLCSIVSSWSLKNKLSEIH